ncbi:MAG: HPr family phosphocarrier protein [Verrucomicrobia bacterium]|nr:HPr family phosphocarrier protein [Verrucomicrobiota bacterium]
MKRVSRKINIQNQLGLHMRLAAGVSRIAQAFDAEISLLKADDSADASSILELLVLGAVHGDPLELFAIGHDAEAALDAICEFLNSYTDIVMLRDMPGSGIDTYAA